MSKIMTRTNLILAVVLVVQLALGVVLLWPRSVAVAENEPLFGELTVADVVSLTLEDADGGTLILQRDTGTWVLPEAGNFVATATKVDDFLGKVLGLRTNRLVTRTTSSHKQLEVADDAFQRRLTLTSADGTTFVLYLGTSPAYGAVHFRLQGQDEAYLTADLTTWDATTSVSSWISTSYVTLDQESVQSFIVENAQGTLSFGKDSAGQWAMAGLGETDVLDQTKVTSLLSRATNVVMSAPLGTQEEASYGMASPNAKVTVTLADRTVSLLVGAMSEDGQSYICKSSESPYYVKVSQYSANEFVDKTPDDLLAPPPETVSE